MCSKASACPCASRCSLDTCPSADQLPMLAESDSFQDVLLWPDKAFSANQTDVSEWIDTGGADKVLVSGVWVNASAAVTLTCGVFGSNDRDTEQLIGSFNLNSLGAWWDGSIPAVTYRYVRLRVQCGNAVAVLSEVFFRLLHL